MYCDFFGLRRRPFKLSPDLAFFYQQADRETLLQALLFAVRRGDGLMTVIGEVGVGKTTLLHLLSHSLPKDYRPVQLASPNVNAHELLKLICLELALPVTANDTQQDLTRLLQQFLIEQHCLGQRVILLVDEAQAIVPDTLEELRLLSNLETHDDKLLQMILFGQPELEATLNDVRLRPIKDRVVHQFRLQPLNSMEVMAYLNYRMRVAGYLQADVFSLKTARRIRRLSKGLPRAINLCADKLLMAAFSRGDRVLNRKHFQVLEGRHRVRGGVGWFVAVSLVGLLSITSWYGLSMGWQGEAG